MRWDLDPTEVEQAVQFLQDGPSITPLPEGLVCLPAQSRAWRRFQETDSYSRRAGQGRRRSLPLKKDLYLLFCEGGTGWALLELQNDLQQVTGGNVSVQTIINRLHEGGLMARRPLVDPGHCSAPWSLIDICHKMPELAPLVPCVFHRWNPEHMWQMWKRLENVAVTSLWMTCLVVGQWWFGEAFTSRGTQTSTDLAKAPWLPLQVRMKYLDPLSDLHWCIGSWIPPGAWH